MYHKEDDRAEKVDMCETPRAKRARYFGEWRHETEWYRDVCATRRISIKMAESAHTGTMRCD